jgi:hypothetical protein
MVQRAFSIHGGVMTAARETLTIVILSVVAGVGFGYAAGKGLSSPPIVDAGPSAKVEHAADQQNTAAVKQAVTKRRSADRRVAQEVQREVTTSDLADYLGAHATSGGAPLGGDSDRSSSDHGDGPTVLGGHPPNRSDSLAPGAP